MITKHADFLKSIVDKIMKEGIPYPYPVSAKKGYFIAFEGVDGCGKSYQVKLLEEALQKTGFVVQTFRSPGSTRLGETIRSITKDPTSNIAAEAELMLMCADRAQLVTECIKPALEAGQVVICDRFYHSTLIYQGWGRQIDKGMVSKLAEYSVVKTFPDLTFVLDVTPETAAARSAKRGTTDKFELLDDSFQSRIREGFNWLKNKEKESNGRLITINANLGIEDVHNEIYRCVAYRISTLTNGALELDAGKRIIT